MAKRIVVKVGSYTNAQNETKGEYVKVGVILSNDNGEFILLDPSINMAGLLLKQQINGIAKNGSDSVIASIFSDEQNQSAPQKAASMSQANQAPSGANEHDPDIPFMSYEYKSVI